jgi:hypothetical protein
VIAFFEKFFAFGRNGAVFADEASRHLGVGVGFLFGREASGLAIASGDYARANGGGIFAGRSRHTPSTFT